MTKAPEKVLKQESTGGSQGWRTPYQILTQTQNIVLEGAFEEEVKATGCHTTEVWLKLQIINSQGYFFLYVSVPPRSSASTICSLQRQRVYRSVEISVKYMDALIVGDWLSDDGRTDTSNRMVAEGHHFPHCHHCGYQYQHHQHHHHHYHHYKHDHHHIIITMTTITLIIATYYGH